MELETIDRSLAVLANGLRNDVLSVVEREALSLEIDRFLDLRIRYTHEQMHDAGLPATE